jgi:hypothetical protein
MRRRMLMVIAAGTIGGLFAAGLFLHGRVGGGLLLITDALLIALGMSAWANTQPQKRPIRVAVILIIGAIAVVKMIRG